LLLLRFGNSLIANTNSKHERIVVPGLMDALMFYVGMSHLCLTAFDRMLEDTRYCAQTTEPPYNERYVWWREKSAGGINPGCLLDD
jgi:hypothetical protein